MSAVVGDTRRALGRSGMRLSDGTQFEGGFCDESVAA
jgi:hypothetical protein